eukprot:gnl/TRDRNA2_/TRDRNA2_106577_c0_seq1.p1 gnl/TRDRNA2_/TRDRNA2_106577_c0~~gnl/TRDRNA2_/TRDRNA2_106577_c0_seq1.p1  ORF type:complete len:154 (+),score=33.95 gnl/TRDRNA2_/TRDRNA2_106577_c0_seq1:295-756(+)
MTQPGNPLEVAGNKVGISFNNARKIYETMDAHRIVEWCKKVAPQKHDALMEVMFRHYFQDGADLTKREVLLGFVDEVGGLDRKACESMLAGADLKREVLTGIQKAHDLDVSGVPFFIVEAADPGGNKGRKPTAFSGAQPADVIRNVLEKYSTA